MSEVLEATHSSPIPDIFYCEKENKKFTQCTICGKSFENTNELYLIEKAYEKKPGSENHQLVFELACCMDCRQEINESLSQESRENITAYFQKNTNVEKRDADLKKYNLMDHELWLQNCIVKNKSISEVEEYQIYVLCWKDKLVYHHLPYMLCGETIEEIMGLLSKKSLDILNDFMTDLFDLPPEFNEIFGRKKVLIF
jgi:hypothetical protein